MSNRLAKAGSLYLRQHKDNPVDWWQWGPESLAEAKRREVPLFISIGYAACHWCHVMERESFEDPDLARRINEMAVPIKIDREERPDLDALYMEAVQAFTGNGGWPMTIFATPEGAPFFAGTYFPPTRRSGMPGLIEIVEAVKEAWTNRRDDLEKEALRIKEAVRARATLPPSSLAATDIDSGRLLGQIEGSLLERADRQWGGMGSAPKFPQPYLIDFLLYKHYLTGSQDALEVALHALDQMARGGIFDHLGGGFARYSTDRFWVVPHFEKMLYDQAGLLGAYASAFALTKESRFRYVAESIHRYVSETLRLPEGGLASSQDADSEGEEGAYYVFRLEEVQEALGAEANDFIEYYGLTRSGNFEGKNIIHRPINQDYVPNAQLENLRERLLAYRAKRPAPAIDDKVVTEWNAAYSSALLRAARLLGHEEWTEEALGILQFLYDYALDEGDVLHRIIFGTRSSVPAMCLDYASLIEASLEAYASTGKASYVDKAEKLSQRLIAEYFDDADGGFFTSSRTERNEVADLKDFSDGATLSANSVATRALLRLGTLLDRSDLLGVAERTLDYLGDVLTMRPGAFTSVGTTLHEIRGGLRELVILGEVKNELSEVAFTSFLPDAVLAIGESLGNDLFTAREEGKAYLCQGKVCQVPASSAEQLYLQLSSNRFLPQTRWTPTTGPTTGEVTTPRDDGQQ